MSLRSSLRFVTFHQILNELCPFLYLEYRNNTVFRTFFRHALKYWAEILCMALKWCLTDQVHVLSDFVKFWMSYAPLLDSLHIGSFPHFLSTCFEVLSWNFVYVFVMMSHRSSLSFMWFHQILNELCPFFWLGILHI